MFRYAEECEATHPILAEDVRELASIQGPPEPPAPKTPEEDRAVLYRFERSFQDAPSEDLIELRVEALAYTAGRREPPQRLPDWDAGIRECVPKTSMARDAAGHWAALAKVLAVHMLEKGAMPVQGPSARESGNHDQEEKPAAGL